MSNSLTIQQELELDKYQQAVMNHSLKLLAVVSKN